MKARPTGVGSSLLALASGQGVRGTTAGPMATTGLLRSTLHAMLATWSSIRVVSIRRIAASGATGSLCVRFRISILSKKNKQDCAPSRASGINFVKPRKRKGEVNRPLLYHFVGFNGMLPSSVYRVSPGVVQCQSRGSARGE